jgi:hypothetical protein
MSGVALVAACLVPIFLLGVAALVLVAVSRAAGEAVMRGLGW